MIRHSLQWRWQLLTLLEIHSFSSRSTTRRQIRLLSLNLRADECAFFSSPKNDSTADACDRKRKPSWRESVGLLDVYGCRPRIVISRFSFASLSFNSQVSFIRAQLKTIDAKQSSTGAGEHQRRLLKYLLEENKHNPLERPVLNDTHSMPVSMNLALQQIIDFVSPRPSISRSIGRSFRMRRTKS